MTPQPTEQYGQVLRVSLVRASLNSRTSARTRLAEKPSAVRLVAPLDDAVTLRNCRRVNARGTPRPGSLTLGTGTWRREVPSRTKPRSLREGGAPLGAATADPCAGTPRSSAARSS